MMPACRMAPPKRCLKIHALFDKVARSCQHRADRRSQSLAQVHPHGVEWRREGPSRRSARHDGVEETGAVHVGHEPSGMRRGTDLLDPVERPAHAADRGAGLLDRDGSSARHEVHRGPDGFENLVGGEEPVGPRERTEYGPDQRRGAAGLVQHRMRQLLKQDFVSGPAVHRESHLIAHRAGGKKKRRLLTQEIGDNVLQEIDGGIFALLLVADFRLAHEPPHRRRRTGDGIAEQIDLYHSIVSILRRPARRGIIVASAQTPTTASPESTSWGVIPTGC